MWKQYSETKFQALLNVWLDHPKKCWALIFFIVFLFCLFGHGGVLYMTPPWKITDPHKPGYNPENFFYEDYSDIKEFHEALRVTFPIGTSRQKVDRILYEKLKKREGLDDWGASMQKTLSYPEKLDEKNIVQYHFTPPVLPINIWNIMVFYDENDRLKEIADHGVPIHNLNYYKKDTK